MTHDDVNVASEVLRAGVDAAGDLPHQLMPLRTLQELFGDAEYLNKVAAQYGGSGERCYEAANTLYIEAVKWYNMHEYARAYAVIVDKLQKLQPVNPLTIKLLVANIQCLGYFGVAGVMYRRYFEVSDDVDSLFYAGLCSYCAKQHKAANDNLARFLQVVSASEQLAHKYDTLHQRAKKLLENLSEARSAS